MPLYMICNAACINEYGVVAMMAKNLRQSILPHILPLKKLLNDLLRIR